MEGNNKAYVVVILVQVIYSALYILSKAAFDHGMSNFIFVFYRQAFATVLLIPVAFFFERKTAPPLSFKTFCQMFFIALIGITSSLDLNGLALVYTSPTLGAATANLLPVITFILALLLRIEALKLKTGPGIAKLIGVVACLCGVLILAFYKGPHWKIHYQLIGYHKSQQNHATSSGTWIKGCFIQLLSVFFWGLWIVLQTFVIKNYPSKLLFTTLQCLFSTIQSFVIAIAVERDMEQWKLGWNIGLLAVAYSGIVVSGITFYLQSWIVEKKGAVFLAMSTPLSFIITLLASTFLLGEIINLGSILGGLALVLGLYCVLWGKSREQMLRASLDLEQVSASR